MEYDDYCNLVSNNEKIEDYKLTFSPNPFSAQTNIETNTPLNNATLTILNSIGKQLPK
jgi:hypothetical protein